MRDATSRLAEEHGGKVVERRSPPRRPRPRLLLRAHRPRPPRQRQPRGRRTRSSARSSSVIGYDDVDDAVRIANDSIYGLSAQVYGADVGGRHRRGAPPAHRRGQRQHLRRSAPTRRAAATSRAASAASEARRHPGLPGGQAHGDRRAPVNEPTSTSTGSSRSTTTSSSRPTCGSTGCRRRSRPGAPHGDRDDGIEYWVYDGKRFPTLGPERGRRARRRRSSAPSRCPTREMRPGCYDPVARLEDMDRAGILASVCFPTITRFCGQLFMEASDRDFGLVCLKAYNDWMIDEWCGAAPGRYIPLVLIPMWDPPLAVAELERCAAKGATSFAVLGEPVEPLGLPDDPRPGPLLGPGDGGGERARDGRVHARRVRRRRCPRSHPTSPFIANLTWGADPHLRARCCRGCSAASSSATRS